MKKQESSGRLKSLDALRGFDMFFIMGGDSLIVALCLFFPGSPVAGFIADQMHHVDWEGFAFYDNIFPLFLFIAGISFPFSLAKSRAKGQSTARIYGHIFRRAFLLVLFCAVCNGLLWFNFSEVRYAGVLTRIGLAWMFAAILFLNFNTRARIVWACTILIGYWLLLLFVPAPDANGAGVFTAQGSLAGYIDRHYLPGVMYVNTAIVPPIDPPIDPEGLLSTVPAIVTAMLGMFVGEFLKTARFGFSPARKAATLAGAGILLLLVGYGWSFSFPIIKVLWTSSFVCFAGGFSLLLFALFYYIVDVRGRSGWTPFFTIIGLNSITIYLAQYAVDFRYTSRFFVEGIAYKLPELWAGVVQAAGYIAVCWLFLWFLYKKQVFLKV